MRKMQTYANDKTDSAESKSQKTVIRPEDNILELIFPNLDLSLANYEGEISTISPFPRKISNKTGIYEQRPSFCINIKTQKWIDQANPELCGNSFSDLLLKVNNIPVTSKAERVIENVISRTYKAKNFNQAQLDFKIKLQDISYKKRLKQFHIDPKIALELGMGFLDKPNELFSLPIYMFGEIVDVRTYYPGQTPKVKSMPNPLTGVISAKPLWENDNRITFLCAGEKDMLAMRSLGYNAISITGGEGTIPKLFGDWFIDREVVVCYDNDKTGIDAGIKLSAWLLKNNAKTVYNFTQHHTDENISHIKGTDMWDLIDYYGSESKSVIDEYLKETEPFSREEFRDFKNKQIPLIQLSECIQTEHIGQLRQSIVQASTDVDANYFIPKAIVATKYDVGEKEAKNMIPLNQKIYWDLDKNTMIEVMQLIQNDRERSKIIKTSLLGIPASEEYISCVNREEVGLHRLAVTGYTPTAIESTDAVSNENFTISAYIIGYRMKAGCRYQITYKSTPDPLNKQKAVIVVCDVEEIDDIKEWTLNNKTRANLIQLAQLDKKTPEKLLFHWNQDLARLKEFNNKDLWLSYNLLFNTPLKFRWYGKEQRATLDMIAIGESRAGKGILAKELIKKYNVGKIIQADSSTVDSFLGGTVDSPNGPVVKTGALLKENGRLVVIEEIKDKAESLIPKMRDLRSEGILKLGRVASQIEAKLDLRILMISNPKVDRSEYLNIRQNFEDGLAAVKSIIPATEDLTRFDLLFLVDNPNNLKLPTPNPNTYKYVDKVSDTWYQDAIRWVWSRKIDEVVFNPGVCELIYEQAKLLSKELNSMENIYGTECAIKLARLSIAFAGFTLSSDDEFNNLIVTKYHVNFIVNWLKSIYINDLFRWQVAVEKQNKARICTQKDIDTIKEIIENQYDTLLDVLNTTNSDGMHTNNIITVSGIDRAGVDNTMAKLRRCNLIISTPRGNWKRCEKFSEAYRKAKEAGAIPQKGVLDD